MHMSKSMCATSFAVAALECDQQSWVDIMEWQEKRDSAETLGVNRPPPSSTRRRLPVDCFCLQKQTETEKKRAKDCKRD